MQAPSSRVLFERRVRRTDDTLSLDRRGAGYWDTDVDMWWSLWQAAVRVGKATQPAARKTTPSAKPAARARRRTRALRVSRSAFTQDENGNRYPIPRTPGKRRVLGFTQDENGNRYPIEPVS